MATIQWQIGKKSQQFLAFHRTFEYDIFVGIDTTQGKRMFG